MNLLREYIREIMLTNLSEDTLQPSKAAIPLAVLPRDNDCPAGYNYDSVARVCVSNDINAQDPTQSSELANQISKLQGVKRLKPW
jgi:hypothetical protein